MIFLDDIRSDSQAQLPDGRWIPARPLNNTKPYRSFLARLRDAWEVFKGRADALKWDLRQPRSYGVRAIGVSRQDQSDGAPMTIEEAIRHCQEVASACPGTKCSLNHLQLAEWLQALGELEERLAQEGALRMEAERVQEWAKLHTSPIEFFESDGTKRRIAFFDKEPGFTDDEWRPDDKAWDERATRERKLLGMVEKLATGLEWHIENCPEIMNGCDDEALLEAKTLIAEVEGAKTAPEGNPI